MIGDQGEHVALIQAALLKLGNSRIGSDELSAKKYGKETAAAVLDFKKKRNIINAAYQTVPDDIVGKMTIKHLDSEMCLGDAVDVRDCYGGSLRPVFGKNI
jgi:peptidoglycan hydrolase-like protein with peptidoglycan-binding domain